MEKVALMTAVKTSISDVLETMFFLPIEFSEVEATDDPVDSLEKKSLLAARISFRGPLAGNFTFFIPLKLARSLTGSFLGEEEGLISELEITGTVQEILNMITGKAFSLLDDRSIFDLAIPMMIDAEEALSERPEESTLLFSLLVHTVDEVSLLKMTLLS
jgi:CheY-specific phosphatase CheX